MPQVTQWLGSLSACRDGFLCGRFCCWGGECRRVRQGAKQRVTIGIGGADQCCVQGRVSKNAMSSAARRIPAHTAGACVDSSSALPTNADADMQRSAFLPLRGRVHPTPLPACVQRTRLCHYLSDAAALKFYTDSSSAAEAPACPLLHRPYHLRWQHKKLRGLHFALRQTRWDRHPSERSHCLPHRLPHLRVY